MAKTTRDIRQHKGCGYEPAGKIERAKLTVWKPPSGARGYHGPELTTCAGYTANLPEVVEATVARAHWKVGAIVPACGGEMPTEDLMNSILVLDAAYSEVEIWLMTPSADGGGGK